MNVTTGWGDEGKCFDVIYLDFSKAFDVVCHKRLAVKLQAIGIGGKIIEWVENWLSPWKQHEVKEENNSNWADVVSSAIQMSVLGDSFLDIFIDDIKDATKEATEVFHHMKLLGFKMLKLMHMLMTVLIPVIATFHFIR